MTKEIDKGSLLGLIKKMAENASKKGAFGLPVKEPTSAHDLLFAAGAIRKTLLSDRYDHTSIGIIEKGCGCKNLAIACDEVEWHLDGGECIEVAHNLHRALITIDKAEQGVDIVRMAGVISAIGYMLLAKALSASGHDPLTETENATFDALHKLMSEARNVGGNSEADKAEAAMLQSVADALLAKQPAVKVGEDIPHAVVDAIAANISEAGGELDEVINVGFAITYVLDGNVVSMPRMTDEECARVTGILLCSVRTDGTYDGVIVAEIGDVLDRAIDLAEKKLVDDGTYHAACSERLTSIRRGATVARTKPKDAAHNLEILQELGGGVADADEKGKLLMKMLRDRQAKLSGAEGSPSKSIH